jgi:Domain of unknown function (DUF4922)
VTEAIERLFERQLKVWPLLASGTEGLARARTRQVGIDWFEVHVRHIPHRVISTTAAVDRASIERRPCFLCRQNMPPQQEGVEFNQDFTIYCNPYPIVDRHVTIVHREHGPQRIAGQLEAFLDIAKALQTYFVIYNGPECGASAPDHLHFQAGLRNLFPIEHDAKNIVGPAIPNYARNVFLFRGNDRKQLAAQIENTIGLLAAVTGKSDEPLINIAAFHDLKTRWNVYVFPRGKHRPEVFHTGELTVSPASIDLCGIFVAPLEKDFARLSAHDIKSIFREVTLSDEQMKQVLARQEGHR